MRQMGQPALCFARNIAATFLTFTMAVPASGGTAWAAMDFGTWLNTDKKGKLELRECGNEGLCSEIVWLKEPNDENGKPWRDILNPDPSKRRRPVVGIDVLEGLKKIGPNTWQGKIYDPEVGKLYYLKHIKIGTDKVEIKGCLSTGWPCRTKYWTRTKPVRTPEPLQVAKPMPAPRAVPAPRTVPVQRRAAVVPVTPQAVRPVQRQAGPPPNPTVRPPRPVQPYPSAQVRPAPSWAGQTATVAVARAAPVTTGSLNQPSHQPRPMTAAPPAAASGYLVQVTAGQDQNEALQTFSKLQYRFPHILGGYLPNVQQVDLGRKGVWYRVRVGPMGARTAAVNFCNKLKAAGGDCIIRNQ